MRSYAQAQERMDDLTRSDSVTLAIRQLNTLAVALKAGRVARGALTLASPEVRTFTNISRSDHSSILKRLV